MHFCQPAGRPEMRHLMKRTFALMLASLMIAGLSMAPAFAVSEKTVKYTPFTTNVAKIEKRASKVRTGTTDLTIRKGAGYMKFTAPKSGKYSFAFSKVKGKDSSNAYVSFCRKDTDFPKYTKYAKVATRGGKTSTLWLSVNGAVFSYENLLSRPLASRTARITMKKGQTLYMHFSGSAAKHTARLDKETQLIARKESFSEYKAIRLYTHAAS